MRGKLTSVSAGRQDRTVWTSLMPPFWKMASKLIGTHTRVSPESVRSNRPIFSGCPLAGRERLTRFPPQHRAVAERIPTASFIAPTGIDPYEDIGAINFGIWDLAFGI